MEAAAGRPRSWALGAALAAAAVREPEAGQPAAPLSSYYDSSLWDPSQAWVQRRAYLPARRTVAASAQHKGGVASDSGDRPYPARSYPPRWHALPYDRPPYGFAGPHFGPGSARSGPTDVSQSRPLEFAGGPLSGAQSLYTPTYEMLTADGHWKAPAHAILPAPAHSGACDRAGFAKSFAEAFALPQRAIEQADPWTRAGPVWDDTLGAKLITAKGRREARLPARDALGNAESNPAHENASFPDAYSLAARARAKAVQSQGMASVRPALTTAHANASGRENKAGPEKRAHTASGRKFGFVKACDAVDTLLLDAASHDLCRACATPLLPAANFCACCGARLRAPASSAVLDKGVDDDAGGPETAPDGTDAGATTLHEARVTHPDEKRELLTHLLREPRALRDPQALAPVASAAMQAPDADAESSASDRGSGGVSPTHGIPVTPATIDAPRMPDPAAASPAAWDCPKCLTKGMPPDAVECRSCKEPRDAGQSAAGAALAAVNPTPAESAATPGDTGAGVSAADRVSTAGASPLTDSSKPTPAGPSKNGADSLVLPCLSRTDEEAIVKHGRVSGAARDLACPADAPVTPVALTSVRGFGASVSRPGELALSADGLLVFTAASLAVLQAADGRQLGFWSRHSANIIAMALDSNRQHVATAQQDAPPQGKERGQGAATIQVWSARTCELIADVERRGLEGGWPEVQALGFSGAGQLLVVLHANPLRMLVVYHWRTSCVVAKSSTLSDPREGSVFGLCCCPVDEGVDVVRFATFGIKHLRFWLLAPPAAGGRGLGGGALQTGDDGKDRCMLSEAARHQDKPVDMVVTSCEYVPNKPWLVAASMPSSVLGPEPAAAWRGGDVVTGMRNGSLCVWQQGILSQILPLANGGAVCCLRAIVQTHHHASPPEAGEHKHRKKEAKGRDGQLLERCVVGVVAGGRDGKVRVWTLADLYACKAAKVVVSVGTRAAMNINEAAAAAAAVRAQSSSDKLLPDQFSAVSMTLLRLHQKDHATASLKGPNDLMPSLREDLALTSLDVCVTSPLGLRVVVGTRAGSIYDLDIQTGGTGGREYELRRVSLSVQGAGGAAGKTLTAVALHPRKPFLVTCADDGWLRVWPLGPGGQTSCTREIELTAADGWRRHCVCLAFSPARLSSSETRAADGGGTRQEQQGKTAGAADDGAFLACGLTSGEVVVFSSSEVLDMHVLHRVRLPEASDGVFALSYSPDGSWLAAATQITQHRRGDKWVASQTCVILDANHGYSVVCRCSLQTSGEKPLAQPPPDAESPWQSGGVWEVAWKWAPYVDPDPEVSKAYRADDGAEGAGAGEGKSKRKSKRGDPSKATAQAEQTMQPILTITGSFPDREAVSHTWALGLTGRVVNARLESVRPTAQGRRVADAAASNAPQHHGHHHHRSHGHARAKAAHAQAPGPANHSALAAAAESPIASILSLSKRDEAEISKQAQSWFPPKSEGPHQGVHDPASAQEVAKAASTPARDKVLASPAGFITGRRLLRFWKSLDVPEAEAGADHVLHRHNPVLAGAALTPDGRSVLSAGASDRALLLWSCVD